MERLLYVALTRARHTLVLAFDHFLFHTAQGASPKNSQARWLRSAKTEENGEVFGKLPKEARCCLVTQQEQREGTIQRELEQKLTLLPEIGAKTKRDGLKRAADYVRKLNPSRVAGGQVWPISRVDTWKETDPELRPLAVESAATRYGLWWHEFAQQIPWTADANAHARIFDEHQLRSRTPLARFGNGTFCRNILTIPPISDKSSQATMCFCIRKCRSYGQAKRRNA